MCVVKIRPLVWELSLLLLQLRGEVEVCVNNSCLHSLGTDTAIHGWSVSLSHICFSLSVWAFLPHFSALVDKREWLLHLSPTFPTPLLYLPPLLTVELVFPERREIGWFSEKEERKMRELETNGERAEWQITCLPFLHISSATLSSHAHVLSLTYSYKYIHKLSSKLSFSHPYSFSSSFSSSCPLISPVECIQGNI